MCRLEMHAFIVHCRLACKHLPGSTTCKHSNCNGLLTFAQPSIPCNPPPPTHRHVPAWCARQGGRRAPGSAHRGVQVRRRPAAATRHVGRAARAARRAAGRHLRGLLDDRGGGTRQDSRGVLHLAPVLLSAVSCLALLPCHLCTGTAIITQSTGAKVCLSFVSICRCCALHLTCAACCCCAVCPLQDVAALLDRGVYDNEVLHQEGWVTALKYEDEITDDLKKRTGGKVGAYTQCTQHCSLPVVL